MNKNGITLNWKRLCQETLKKYLEPGNQQEKNNTMNQPERSAAYVLPEGTQKMTYTKDEKIPNAALFKINCEDHTVGNVVRMALLENEKVTFASYQHPHPTENHIVLKIQCKQGTEPNVALAESITEVQQNLEYLADAFRKATQDQLSIQLENANQNAGY